MDPVRDLKRKGAKDAEGRLWGLDGALIGNYRARLCLRPKTTRLKTRDEEFDAGLAGLKMTVEAIFSVRLAERRYLGD